MLSLKEKYKIGCACLAVLFVTLWIIGLQFPASSTNPPAAVETSPVVIYTFEQQQDSFKSWMKDFELKTNAVNEQWKDLNKLLEVTGQERIYDKLDAVLQNLENLEGTYSSLQPPKELNLEQQRILKQVSSDMDNSISCRVKFVKFTEAYLLHEKNTSYRQSQDQKQLIDMYQKNSSIAINKLVETFKLTETFKIEETDKIQ